MFNGWEALSETAKVTEFSSAAIIVQLVLAVICGWCVALTYFAAQRKSIADAYPFMTTLILLTVLVSMTALIIGESVARAFSLVGALSIVRFRTVVEDTRDTAFVIYAVVAGMAMGSNHGLICLLGVPVISLTAIGTYWLGKTWGPPAGKRTIQIRLGNGHDVEQTLTGIFGKYLSHYRLASAVTAKQGAAMDYRYIVEFQRPHSQLALLKELNRLEGVQQLEWHEDA